MQKNTREKILGLEMFQTNAKIGCPINAMLLHSSEIATISGEELHAELASMEADGLIFLERGAYWATANGRVACQKYLAQAGILQEPLAKQKQHRPDDLILAIAASDRVDPLSGYSIVPRDALKIYLHEFPEDEVHAAIERLIETGLIEESEFLPEESLNITGVGFQRYLLEVHQRLNLGREVGILSQLLPVTKDERFGQLGLDAQFSENIKIRWREMEVCANSGAYLASVILLGSILEGVLLAKLKTNINNAIAASKAPIDKKTGSKKALDEWNLHDYISVAIDLGYIPKCVEKHLHELRDSRNLVHPNKQINSGISVDGSLYRISREVAETIIDALVGE